MRFSFRSLLCVTLVFALLIGAGLWLKRNLEHGVGVAYASWGCGDLLVDFLESNSDHWPNDDADLERFYTNSGKQYVGIGSYSYLKRNFVIDFTFDPATDSASWIADPVAQRVVRYRDGGPSYVAGHEANSRVLTYLINNQAVIRCGGEPRRAPEDGFRGLPQVNSTVRPR